MPKSRCMLMGCDKKSIEETEGIYLCREHRSRKLDKGKKYRLKDMREVKFKEEENAKR